MLRRFIGKMINATVDPNPTTPPARNVISIIGPTGVGKSQLSIELARRFNGEIINADSMQMYKNLPQITNKHPIDERFGVPHHVMNHVDWDQEYSVLRFKSEAMAKIDELLERGKTPIIVGGTFYYLQSLLLNNRNIEREEEQQDASENEDEEAHEDDVSKLTDEQKAILNGPPDILFNTLKQVDPVISQKFHPNDTRRIRRALEVYYVTGKPASEIYSAQKSKQTEETSLRYNCLFFWLHANKASLDPRLDTRVDKMMANGALDEIYQLYSYYTQLDQEPDLERGVWQVIGFKEFLPFLKSEESRKLIKETNGKVSYDLVSQDSTFKECTDNMKLRTRAYAKRQDKWIKNALIPLLNKEATHGWPNFGKVYLLDATNLADWNTNVNEKGVSITQDFMHTGRVPDSVSQQPEYFTTTMVNQSGQGDEEKFGESKWKHYTCDVCVDKDSGKPLVLIGDQYKAHLKSKRHKRSMFKGSGKRKYEAMLAAKNLKELS